SSSDSDADADSTTSFDDNTITAEAGGNTLRTGNNIVYNVSDSSSGSYTAIAMAISTLTMLEALREDGNAGDVDALVSRLVNVLDILSQQNNNRSDELLDAINSLREE
uniref:hypothetical protein n=1 Tax=Bacillus piscicola TaxID=1632684 RepID=UPI001F0A00B2